MTQGIFALPKPINEPICPFLPGSAEKKALKSTLSMLSEQITSVPLVIAGEHKSSKENAKVLCPHRKAKVIAYSAQAEKKDVQEAIEQALKARKNWARLPWEERASVFMKAAELLSGKYRHLVNASTMLGQSKSCYQAEIDAACELIDFFRFNNYFAQQIYAEQPVHSPTGVWNRSEARGLEGFVFAVAPFNFTSISVNLATSCALMGNTVVWKPAPTAVLSSYFVLKLLEEAGLPAGVINMVTGDAAMIGETVLAHPSLAGIHFTGSTATFNHLSSEVAKHLPRYKNYPRVVGETGGKDFIFAHSSADEDLLVTSMIRGAFEYQGQKCSAASRAYVPKSLWKRIKDRLISEVSAIKMGDPQDFSHFMNAVIDQRAFDKIQSAISFAKHSSDALVIAGGDCDDRVGYYIRPTLIETSQPQFKTMQEELFGPVLTIFPYDDDKFEETLQLCDETSPYALTGAIFAQDRHMIYHMVSSLEHAAGNFYINDKPTGAVVGQQPFGGARKSGTNDKAGSMINLLRWVSHRTIKENFVNYPTYKYPFMQES